MAEYIDRGAFLAHMKRTGRYFDVKYDIENFPAADVTPVVRCRDCIYTRKLYGRLVCKHGTCSGCILREDFFCANGVTRTEKTDDN